MKKIIKKYSPKIDQKMVTENIKFYKKGVISDFCGVRIEVQNRVEVSSRMGLEASRSLK